MKLLKQAEYMANDKLISVPCSTAAGATERIFS